MFWGAVPWLPSLRGTVLVTALLVGAYGVDAGLVASGALLVMYAAGVWLRYAAAASFRWLLFTRKRVSDIKILDDKKMKSFQRVTLQIFDLPHHPRRLRQAVRRWREWRENRNLHDDATRGDGLRTLHDPAPGRTVDADGNRLVSDTAGDACAGASPVLAALERSALCRAMSPETIRKLSENCAREVHVAAGEDVFRGRAREDDIVVLVSGAVALGDDPGDVGVEDAAEPTVVTRPGTTLNSLLDVLEGSLSAHTDERATRLVDAAAEAAAEAAANVEADANVDSLRASATPAGIKRLGEALAEAAATERRAESDGDADEGSYPANRLAPTVADAQPYTLHPTRIPTPTSPLGVRVSTRSPAATPEHSYPTTPTRGGATEFTANGDGARTPGGTPDRSGRAGPPGSGRVSERIAFSEHRVSDFSGGPGGLPRLRARGAEGGCVLAAVSTRDFHLAAGFQLGVRAPAMRLAGGYHALCHYLCAPSELAALWVDPAPSAAPASGAGASSALTRLLGAAAAAAVDASSLTHALERRGYVPRREGGDYAATTLTDESDVADDDAPSLVSSAATSARGGSTVELEAIDLAPGEAVRCRSAAAAVLVERGTLEGYWTPPGVGASAADARSNAPKFTRRSGGGRGRGRGGGGGGGGASDVGRDGDGSRTSEPVFVARAGSSVGAFLLLTGQRSAVTLRAGPGGAVVAALPHSAAARLARSRPSLYARVAARIARRLRGSLPARVWDRCGAEWIRLEAGARLRPETSVVADPDGVYVVVTGCLRVASENAAHDDQTDAGLGFGDGGNARRSDFSARFLGPGEAVGEDAALRGGRFDRGTHRTFDRETRSAPRRLFASSSDDATHRCRAVRDTQVLWIPASGLDALAAAAPRAFVSLAWRAGARSNAVGSGADHLGHLDHLGGVEFAGSHVAAGIHGRGGTTGAPSTYHPTTSRAGDAARAPSAPRTVAVVPVSEGAALALDEFCGAVLAALRETCVARVADSASRLAEVGQAGVGPLAGEATAHWLAQLEATNDVVLLKADPFPSPWCAECSRHADAILLVAAADDSPPGAEEGHVLQARLLGGTRGGGLAQRELVLLHTSAELTPTGTRPWLEAFGVHRHHHVARAPAHGLAPAHAARLARSLRRQSVGLVLAGGGARGFAHVGVLMALEEEGVPVDMLGGTSMGSFVGGIYAKEPTALLTRIIARRLAVHMSSTWEQLRDLTLPVVSYFSGFRMNRALEPLFRGAKIEDCWLPFFCMTLDLISCAPIVHRNGTLWRYVRASMALVGFLPPVCDRLPPERDRDRDRDGVGGKRARSDSKKNSEHKPGRLHVLVDGGYVNNLPTDVMRAMGARVVLGVDVSGHGLPEARMKPWPDALSGVGILLRQWLPGWLGGGPTCPTMAAMQSHLPYVTDYANAARRFGTVDIMVRPVVADIPILAFGRYAEIVRAGHEAGLRAVRAWKLANPDVLPALDDGARAWRPAAGGGGGRRTRRGAALPSAETLAGARGADAEADGDVAKRERAHASGTQGGFFFRGWGFDGGGGEDEDAWEGSYDRPGAGRGRYDWDQDSDDGGGRRGGGAAFEGERRAEAWVRGGGRYDRGFASPDQPAPSMTRRRAYGSHSQDRLDEFHRS